jgi:HAD superfamily hydrolase (TIGR01484 family)
MNPQRSGPVRPVEVEVVVTDLDGTLWEDETRIPEAAQVAVTMVLDAGVPLLVATGRRVGSTRAPLSTIDVLPPAVVLNGALGIDLSSGIRFHRGGFDAEDAAAVLAVFHGHEVDPCVYVDHDEHPVRVGRAPSTHPDHLVSFGDDVLGGDLVEVVGAEDVLAFSVLGVPEAKARSLGSALRRVARAHVDRDRKYDGYSLTVAPSSHSKWDGVAAFCEHRGLDTGAVMAVGDGPNDVEILANAAVAVVPEDAHPAARAHADHVIGRAADGGGADVVDLLCVG